MGPEYPGHQHTKAIEGKDLPGAISPNEDKAAVRADRKDHKKRMGTEVLLHPPCFRLHPLLRTATQARGCRVLRGLSRTRPGHRVGSRVLLSGRVAHRSRLPASEVRDRDDARVEPG